MTEHIIPLVLAPWFDAAESRVRRIEPLFQGFGLPPMTEAIAERNTSQ